MAVRKRNTTEHSQSIAIVGIGCRFPGGANSPADFWQLLKAGHDAIEEVPASRFDINSLYSPEPMPGKVASRFGGFIAEVERFDAAFFGISPREAICMDPQQRLLLEVVWEAFEDAGQPLGKLNGSDTGVYVGMLSSEYVGGLNSVARDNIDLMVSTGASRNAAAGRISYAFGFEGPSLVVDTDRSSSLVAIHLACRSLREGDASLAVACGTNLVLRPETSIAFSRAMMLAPDGRCKFADESANGFVRSDGVGAIVLKRLDAALKDGDPIYAVVRGGAITSAGNSGKDLFTPSLVSQQKLLRAAYRDARVPPHAVQYVEAHGPGTSVGDPVELQALGIVLGEGRTLDKPLLVGSVKTNIGHAEGAAGIASVIKVALSLKNKSLPSSLHFKRPSPKSRMEQLSLRVQTAFGPWPAAGEPMIAGVSSFGLTGTIAHLVLEGEPKQGPPPVEANPVNRLYLLPLSAKSPKALEDLARAYCKLLAELPDTSPLRDVCHSAALKRDHHSCRQGFVAQTVPQMLEQLQRFLKSDAQLGELQSRAVSREPPKVAFVYPGQGSQWVGMGRELMKTEPAFKDAITECDAAIRKYTDWSLIDVLEGKTAKQHPERIDVIQPTLVAMEIALTALWRAWGVEPDAVVGTSMGEVAAAHCAGILNLDDAMRIICLRSKLLRRLAGQGAMAVVELDHRSTEEAIADFRDKVSIAVHNSPTSIVLSGDKAAVEHIVAKLEEKDVFCRFVNVDVASHSPYMNVLKDDLMRELKGVAPLAARIPFYSTVLDRVLGGGELDCGYWVKNLRDTVLFSDSVQRLLADGYVTFVEVSPHPILWSPVLDGVHFSGRRATAVPSLRRDEDERQNMLKALGDVYAAGYEVDWSRLYGERRAFTRLPSYPWQGERFWHGGDAAGAPEVSFSGGGNVESGPRRELSLSSQLKNLGPKETTARVSLILQEQVARILKVENPAGIDIRTPLRELGLTSVMAVELRNAIGQAMGRTFSTTLLFDYPTIEALTAHCGGGLEPSGASSLAPQLQCALMSRASEPIAVVGMGCRFPGAADNPAQYWDLLRNGRSGIVEVPSDRWDIDSYYDPDPNVPGKMYSKWGGFVSAIHEFDHEFFGISAREAESMDPQQRLLLEVSWQALEQGNQDFRRLAKSRTGVFIGLMNHNDYVFVKGHHQHPENINAHDSTGNATSIAAGRLSYFYGFHGPSITVDTACSSSLVALHLACQSLRNRECRMALAGGANAMLSPENTIAYCKTHMLSPRGRCSTFDGAADGYVRGEGCGMLVLKTMSDAVADGDTILAVIRGSAVNQDGRSNGLTAPNGLAQEDVIGEALLSSGVSPADVDYLEAHGTGTPLGDPIEIRAATAIFGKGRDADHPLYIGSVKTNIGHLEAAAGMAGVIKLIVSMRNKEIPKHLNFEKLNPNISLDGQIVQIATEPIAWRKHGSSRIGAVSSFGFSGTNAHAIIGEAPESRTAAAAAALPGSSRKTHLLTLSAKSRSAAQALAAEYAEFLNKEPHTSLADVCLSANTGRAHLDNRVGVVCDNAEQAVAKLAAYGKGEGAPGLVAGRVQGEAPKIAFLFTGQGAQYPGMGQELYDSESVFREAIDACAELAASSLDVPLTAVLYGDKTQLLYETAYGQPAIFALEYALFNLWRSWDVEPDFVMGHSLGEYGVACAAGVIGVEDAMRLVILRGQLMRSLKNPGIAAAITCNAEIAAPKVAKFANEAAISAINGPSKILVGGTDRAVKAIVAELAAMGIDGKVLDGLIGVHSPLMDPVLAEFEEMGKSIRYSESRLRIVSTLEGRLIDGREMAQPSYWRRLVREPVQFANGMRALHEGGCNLFVEIGPRHTLLGLGEPCCPPGVATWLPSLSKEKSNWTQILESLGQLYVSGAKVGFARFHERDKATKVELPGYPFQRREIKSSTDGKGRGKGRARFITARGNQGWAAALLGERLHSISKDVQFETNINTDELPLLNDHLVFGSLVYPAAGHISRVLLAAETLGARTPVIHNLAFPRPLILESKDDSRVCQVVLSPANGDYPFEVASAGEGGEWMDHASGVLKTGDAGESASGAPSEVDPPEGFAGRMMSGKEFYEKQAASGYELGASFQWLQSLRMADREAWAELHFPPSLKGDSADLLHPGLLDSCFQIATRFQDGEGSGEQDKLFVPFSIERITRAEDLSGQQIRCHVSLRQGSTPESRTVDLKVFVDAAIGLEVVGLRLMRVAKERLIKSGSADITQSFYQVSWQPERTTVPAADGAAGADGLWVLLRRPKDSVADTLEEKLTELQMPFARVFAAERFEKSEAAYRVNPGRADDFDKLMEELLKSADANELRFVHLWGIRATEISSANGGDLETQLTEGCGAILHLVNAIGKASFSATTRVWFVTSGAQVVGAEDKASGLPYSSMWGLARVIDNEYPDLWGGAIDILGGSADEQTQQIIDFIREKRRGAGYLALRGSRRLVPLLVPAKAVKKAGQRATLKPDGGYLVTGGLGALGLQVAGWLVEHGARHVLLVGRRSASAESAAALEKLGETGARIDYLQADIADRNQLLGALGGLGKTWPPLVGVIHAAGVVDDGALAGQTWERFRKVLSPKIQGTLNLHHLTKDFKLDFFVMFSSIAPLVGTSGQSSYAAANGFLDAFAHYRRSLGLPAVSINWGPWSGAGMAETLGDDLFTKWGLHQVVPKDGFVALEEILNYRDISQIAVMPWEAGQFVNAYANKNRPIPVLFELLTARVAPDAQEKQASAQKCAGGFLASLKGLPQREQRPFLYKSVAEIVASVLGLESAASLDQHARFDEMGLDSLLSMDVVRALQSSLGLPLPATVTFDNPNMGKLVDFLSRELKLDECVACNLPSRTP